MLMYNFNSIKILYPVQDEPSNSIVVLCFNDYHRNALHHDSPLIFYFWIAV